MDRKLGRPGIKLLGLIIVCLAIFTVSARAQTPAATAEQLKIFQQLPAAQQQEILCTYGSAGTRTGSTQTPQIPETPTVVIPQSIEQQPDELSSLEQAVLKSFLFDGAPDLKRMVEQHAKRVAAAGAGAKPKMVLPAGAVINELGKPLRQFGYDLFAGAPTTFAPATDIPIPSSYVIGPGDTIVVQLFGKENIEHELVVSRDGVIKFPRIGPISVSGLRFNRLQKLLRNRVEKQFIGVKASVTLGKLRSIRVFVLGDAVRPGSYTVSGLSTLTNALFVSGGIKKIGSLRNIQLKRRGKVVARLDLYDLLLRGDTRKDARLLPGDVIFIPPIGKTAGIDGEVRRPAIYELKQEKTVENLVAMAGGLMPNAWPKGMQLSRIQQARERTVIDLDLGIEEGRKKLLHNGDVARVYSVLDRMEKVVQLSGHIHRPGAYQWKKGMRLTDLISSMLDLKPEVDPRYLLIKRENPRDRTIEVLSADLVTAMADPTGPANIELTARDTVHIFSIHNNRRKAVDPLLTQLVAQASHTGLRKEVAIYGNVHHAGRYPLTPGMRISYLIAAAGGTTDAAYTLQAELSRYKIVDGKEREQSHVVIDLAKVLKNDIESNISLESYDRLVIQRIPKWLEGGVVKLVGEFRFPGDVPIKRGERLSDVLKRAGGLTEEAYPAGAFFVRDAVKKTEREFMGKLADQLERDLALAAANVEGAGAEKQAALAEGQSLLSQLRSAVASGRIVINLKSILKRHGGKYDIYVQPGDMLMVPQRPDHVTVLGEVYHPTSHVFTSKSARRYIDLSGGVNEVGNKKGVYVVKAGGEVNRFSGWFRRNARVDAGSTIIVPLKVDRISGLKLATDITQVIYQISISLASMRTLGII